MNHETQNSASCERADDLIAVLYGEASEGEKHDFELHLKQCGNCRAEFDAFTEVRESIGEWRDEALTGFVSSPVVAAPPRKSALAALRQFFDLSPLWLKGAVGFAAVAFCVLLALAAFRLQPPTSGPKVATRNPEAVYTKQDVERMVQEALAKREAVTRQEVAASDEREQRVVERKPMIVESSGLKNSTPAKSARIPKARRPFSRAEREQLAAELRLVSGLDETDFDPLDK